MANKLALFGGNKVIDKSFNIYNPIGKDETDAVIKVVESGVLSKFIGAWHDDFYGGPKVKEFEEICANYFNVKHCISVNSWTSGLIAAVGAIGIEPGDEVIVTPWTMCATVTAILHWNGIPVFADIEDETFCIDPKSIINNISPYTKAIIAVDIFGHSANMDELNEIAKKYKLKIISDTAQAPGAIYKNQYAGTLADVGGFSLNYHKHIHTGEGGLLVTNDDDIADRLCLIRNHGEAVVEDKGTKHLNNILGYNFRLGEIESAIGIVQISKLNEIISRKQDIANKLNKSLQDIPGLRLPIVKEECTHVYYVYPLLLDVTSLNVKRDSIVTALMAEGLPLSQGYQNLHLLPMFQKKIAYGSKGFPWNSDICHREINYNKGICPTAELLHNEHQIGLNICNYDLSDSDIDLISNVFHKVWDNINYLT